MNTVRSDEHVEKILTKLARGWSVAAACKAAKIGRQTYYDWREADAEFAKLCDDAIESGTDLLEDAATRQAIAGNPSMMALLLKARRPHKYRERVEHTGDPSQPLRIIIHEVEAGTRKDAAS
jgi:Bacteriophage Sf6, terminase small subunit-like